jgi:hypothetical protein
MVPPSFRGGPKQPSRGWGLLIALLLLVDASWGSSPAWSPLSAHSVPSAGLLSLTTLMVTLVPARAQTRRPTLCNMHGIYNATIRRCECVTGWAGARCDEKVRMLSSFMGYERSHCFMSPSPGLALLCTLPACNPSVITNLFPLFSQCRPLFPSLFPTTDVP